MTAMNEKVTPIKILFVSHSSGLYGGEKCLLTFLENLDRKRFDPIVALPGSGPLDDAIARLSIPRYDILFPWWVRTNRNILAIMFSFVKEVVAVIRLCKIINNERVEIVYTNSIVVFTGALSARICGRPHFWHVREILVDNPDLFFPLSNKLLFKLVSSLSQKIVTVSQAVADQFNRENKAVVVYDGLHTAVPCTEGTTAKEWRVLVIGSLQRRKAQDDAVYAAKIARERIPNFKLYLIGKGEKQFSRYLQNLIEELGLQDVVLLTGHRNDIPDFLASSRVLLMPSLAEPSGVVLLEAMAAAKPVIACRSGGAQEIVEDGVTGFLVPPHDPLALADKIVQLAMNETMAMEMGRNARRMLETKFTVRAYSQGIERILLDA